MSFGFSGIFREGSWRAFRTFVMQEFRDVPKRIQAIDAELDRIGRVTIIFATEEQDGVQRATELRKGFSVTPNSSLQKLVQAYIAVGGNPFDISLFSYPDETVTYTSQGVTNTIEAHPYGGVSVPLGVEAAEEGAWDAGWLPNLKYPPRRLGGKDIVWNTTSELIDANKRLRRWITQEIREKRNSIETRILKLCDLREQLLIEKNEWITSAVGNSVSGTNFIEGYHAESARAQKLLYAIDAHFYSVGEDGRLSFDNTNTQGRAFTRFRTLLSNYPEEKWTAL